MPFKITAGILQVNKGLIDTDYGRFSGNLSGLDSPVGPQLKAHGKIENFRPSFFPADLFSGKKLAASADFTMDAAGDLTFRGELQPMQIDGHLLTGGHFEGSSIAGSITIRELTLDMGGGEMTLNGQIDKDALSVAFHFEQLPVQWLIKGQTGTLTGSGSIKKSVDTAYLLSLHLPEMQSSDLELVNFDAILPISDAKESQREPFRIHAEKGVWRKISFESLRIEGSGRGNRYAIDSASILFNQESWRLAGSADFLFDGTDFSLMDFRLASEQSMIVASFNKSKEMVKAKIRVERMKIPETLQLFPLVDFTKGMCDIDLTVDGTLSQPAITFAGRAYYPKAGQDFHLDLAGEVADHLLRINAVAQVANQKVPVKLQMPMHLSFAPFLVNYDVDRLVVFSSISQGAFADFPLLAAYGCDGHFRFEMTMHEKDQQAQWLTGRLNLKEAGCRIPGTNLSIEDGELLFRGEKDRIILEQSKIMSNQGELLLQGEVTDLKNYPAVTGFLTVSSDDINLNYRGIYDMALSGKLTARINKGRRSLRGELTVLSADLKQPMHAAGFDRSDNTVIYASRSAQKGIRRTDILEDLDRMICGTSLDVRIKLPKNVMLHTGELSLQLEGSLHAGGDGSGLELDGKLKAVEGTYTVAGREFKVEEGEVIFSREDGLDPALEGKAVCRMPDLIVTAKVKGTVEKPSILLESEPWMKEDEIKSAIIFGKPVSDLSVQEKNQFDTSVASLLGGTVLNRFNAITGNQTLLDSFSFYSDKQSGNESIAVGKYLTDDLLFSYRQGVKENNAAEVRVEYKLKGGFSLESLYSEEGQKSGFDFFWSKDF
ncbi:MAG: translocation/assembly module TamB [Deltaproteobacteria bacterium]